MIIVVILEGNAQLRLFIFFIIHTSLLLFTFLHASPMYLADCAPDFLNNSIIPNSTTKPTSVDILSASIGVWE